MDAPEQSFERKKRPGCLGFWLKRLGKVLLVLAIVAACTQAWRHYQVGKRLDETLAEIDRAEPGWRLADIEAAREQIPEEENSARVVVAAAKLLPKDWPPKDFDELFAHLAPEEQLAVEDFAQLKRELDNVRPALKEARKLSVMPRGRHHIEYQRNIIATLLPGVDEARRVTRLLICDAMRRDQEGDAIDAMIDCLAALNAGRSVGDEPLAVSQLVRMSEVLAACRAIERALAQGEPPPDDLVALEHSLRREDAFPDLLVAARGERACLHELFDAIESGDVSLSQLADSKSNWEEYASGWFTRHKFRDAHPIMLAQMNRWLNIAQLPMHQQALAERMLDYRVRALKEVEPLSVLFMPALNIVGPASRRKHAYIRCMIVALAAERYRGEEKGWPDNIDQLCPKYLAALPLDPFDGQPLRYRRLEDGIIVYAVGNDGTDDDGNLDCEHPNQPGVDLGCRLWDVAKRRQPPQPKPPKQPAPPAIPLPAFNP